MDHWKDFHDLKWWALAGVGAVWVLFLAIDIYAYLRCVNKVAEECGDRDYYAPPEEK
ncbi:MAG TPA: hypothetical protein VMZ71_02270 [Gemmataceae bacterium]|nr:hypothetical protein [Gemmataceae bacterium]